MLCLDEGFMICMVFGYSFDFIQQEKRQYLLTAENYFEILWHISLEKTTNKDAVSSGEDKGNYKKTLKNDCMQ